MMLSQLSASGRLFAFDVDAAAVRAGRDLEKADGRFRIIHEPFANLAQAITDPVAGVLLDLGVSSPQLDDPRRGFSLKNKKDGPLDLRMNQDSGVPASQWLMTVSAAELAWVIGVVGTELEAPLPERIADAVIQRQREQPFVSTLQFASVLAEIGAGLQMEHPGLQLPQLVFCAIRVFLNQEMAQLRRVLEAAFQRLEPRGRCAVITFSRWEAATVRVFLRQHETNDGGSPFAIRRVGSPLAPSVEELQHNIRSRSALLHVLEKVR